VSASTDSGPIEGDDLGGTRTVARSADGSVRLRLASAQDVEAHADSGPITVIVAPTADGYRLKTHTSSGPTQVHIPTTPTGTRLLDLSTEDGSITVDPR